MKEAIIDNNEELIKHVVGLPETPSIQGEGCDFCSSSIP